MRACHVLISEYVIAQIDAQVLFIANDSIQNALQWEERLRAAIRRIGDNPGAYAVDPEASARFGSEIRKLVFERTYLIFFQVRPGEPVVEILCFRHGSRKPRGREL